MTTIGEIVANLRGSIKEVTDDSAYSNRFLWSKFNTVVKQLVKQEADTGRIYSQSDLWEPICIEMEPVSSIYCNCQFLPYNCEVYRSKYKLPKFLESSDGFVYRWISTPDLSRDFTLVTPYQFHNKSKIKYNREKYAFIHDGYLYTPKDSYPLISLSGLFEGDISDFECNKKEDVVECKTMLSKKVMIPGYLESGAIKMVLSELFHSVQISKDEHTNVNTNQKEVSQ